MFASTFHIILTSLFLVVFTVFLTVSAILALAKKVVSITIGRVLN